MAAAQQDDDIFHSIVMGEEASWRKGYSEGVERSRRKAFEDGCSLGAAKGMEIGKEVGFYAGYATQILNFYRHEKSKARVIKVCEAITQLASKFTDINPMDEALTDNLGKIQGKFKQLTSLLGVQTEYVTVTGDDVKGSSF